MIYVGIAIILLLVFYAFCHYENNKTDITHYTVNSDNATQSFRIVHLSDFHSKPSERIITAAEEQKPDIICITGDFINDKCKNKEKMLEYAKRLSKIAPVYYINGNHERRLECFEALMKELGEAGFRVLRNEIAECEYCTILGLDENQADFEDYKARKNGTFVYKDMSSYFNKLEGHDGFKLVLSHFPENFEGVSELNYSQYDFDLQLSGHAHGGQWIMPFVGPLFSPGQGIFPKYARGSFGEKPRLIVSRGIGNAEFPVRLFNHPEIIVISINKTK